MSPAVRAHALWALGGVARLRGDADRAEALLTDALDRFRMLNDQPRTALALQGLGHVWLRRGEHDQARACQEEAIAILGSLDEPWTSRAASTGLTHLGNIALAQGDLDSAERSFMQAIEMQRALGHEPGASHAYASHPLAGLGDVARARADHARALASYQDALSHAQAFHEVRAIAYALGGIAGTLAAMGQWESAARHFGAAERLHRDAGLSFETETMDRQRALGLPAPWTGEREVTVTHQPLHAAMRHRASGSVPDPDAAARAWATGRSLRLDEAIAEASAVTIAAAKPASGFDELGLSPREFDVLRLLVAGQSDREIGEALFISPRTASKHVSSILSKLGVTSRAEAAVHAVRRHLV
jgi:ATP/maltotriose-dependent transcriptional regulator MalT